jgi:SAM-dependent methyltransferase
MAIPGVDYLSADLISPHAMVKMDITDIDLPDSSFDIVYCSHILEHVTDDLKAMSEMVRVLKPGGLALIQVPISENGTFEDPSITDPGERERLFWQSVHVRLYGLDIKDRLAVAGFDVEVVFGHQLIEPQSRESMGIDSNEVIFHCRKPFVQSGNARTEP